MFRNGRAASLSQQVLSSTRADMLLRRGLRTSGVRRLFSSLRSSDEPYDVVVVGGGVMGAWAAVCAAKRGARVCLADQYEPAHNHGSSHGDGRIYRVAYTEDIYVDMMLHSLPLWRELQAHSGEQLMAETGGVNLGPTDGSRLGELSALYERRGIAHEWLNAQAMNERFPQFSLSPAHHALYQPDFGVLFASKCVSAAWRYADSLGVESRTPFRVAAVRADDDDNGVTVLEGFDGSKLRGRSVVLALGAWMSTLVESWFGLHVPTTVSAETVCYYAPREGASVDHSYSAMPVFCADDDNGLGPFGYYGLPMIDIQGIKASAHYCGPTVHPDHRPTSAGGSATNRRNEAAIGEEAWEAAWATAEADAEAERVADAAAAARVADVIESTSRYVQHTFPHVEHTPFTTQSCLYTSTADHDYVLSMMPSHSRVILAGGGSGHAFKMGPAIGDAAACLALQEEPPFALDRFDVKRLLRLEGDALDHERTAPRR